jgi:hypothetical protein
VVCPQSKKHGSPRRKLIGNESVIVSGGYLLNHKAFFAGLGLLAAIVIATLPAAAMSRPAQMYAAGISGFQSQPPALAASVGDTLATDTLTATVTAGGAHTLYLPFIRRSGVLRIVWVEITGVIGRAGLAEIEVIARGEAGP